jgi:phospholipid/cholesterol/gamma-HCH transport system substrate-binding protein
MKYKFNPFERAVGLFLSFAFFGSVAIGVGIAVKKNWFEDKVSFITYVDSASNIRPGSSVFMAGLKVGRIDNIELDVTKKVKIQFHVLKKFQNSLTKGSKVHFIRPFIIGDKVLSITPGEDRGELLAEGSSISNESSMDLMEIVSHGKIESMITKVDRILGNVDGLTSQINDNKKLQQTIDNMAFASNELRKVLPLVSKNSSHINTSLENLATLTTGLKEMQPVLMDLAKKLPEGSDKTMTLLNESVIVLQAMQKSLLLRGSVEEVKKENEIKRMPASE